MRLDQLNYVLQVSKSGSINRAAKQLFISQSTVSNAISSLEKELGFQIFNRSKNGVTPTELGNELLNHIENVNKSIEQIEYLSHSAHQKSNDLLKITGYKTFLCPQNLDLICQLKREYPELRLMLDEKQFNYILDDILYGRINLGVIACESQDEKNFLQKLDSLNMSYQFLYHDEMTFYCHSEHPLANHPCRLEDLKSYPVISHFNNGIPPKFESIFKKYTINSSLDTMKQLLFEDKNSILLLFRSTLERDILMINQKITTIPVTDIPLESSVFGVYLKNTVLSFFEKKFLEKYLD